jgi:WD40 repeat protein
MSNAVMLQVSITSFTMKGKITYFNICAKYQTKEWTLEKRYNQFADIYTKIKDIVIDPPMFPGKKLIYFNKQNHNEDRKKKLEEFLVGCTSRIDILNTKEFKEFLELEKQVPEMLLDVPELRKEYKENFSMGILQAVVIHEDAQIITAENNMNIGSRTFSGFKGKQIASVNGWEIESKESKKLKLLWEIPFAYMIGIIYYHEASKTLYIGLEKGEIQGFEIKEKSKLTEIIKMQVHNARIKGILYLDGRKTIITVAEDGKLAVIDANLKTVINSIKISDYGLTNLIYEENKSRIFIGDKYGHFYILSTSTLPPVMTVKVSTGIKDYIRCIDVDFEKMLIFIGSDMGFIKILKYDSDVLHPKIEEMELISMHEEMRSMLWLSEANVLAIGSRKGIIRFYDIVEKKFLLNFSAHKDSVKYLYGDENEFFSVSKDKSLAFWKLPQSWIDKSNKNESDFKNNIQKIRQLSIEEEQKEINSAVPILTWQNKFTKEEKKEPVKIFNDDTPLEVKEIKEPIKEPTNEVISPIVVVTDQIKVVKVDEEPVHSPKEGEKLKESQEKDAEIQKEIKLDDEKEEAKIETKEIIKERHSSSSNEENEETTKNKESQKKTTKEDIFDDEEDELENWQN